MSSVGNDMLVTATERVSLEARAIVSCGRDSISSDHEHRRPSVLILTRLWAFCVPTTAAQYTGWTCAVADSGER